MTQDDLMLMAQKAGPLTQGPFDAWCKRFAALVAAHEREACAKVCEAGINNATDWDNSYWDQCCENRAAAIRARGNA